MSVADHTRSYLEALNSRDFGRFRSLLAEDIEFNLSAETVFRAPEEVTEMYRSVLTANPDLQIEVQTMVADDEWVAMEVRITPADPPDRRAVFHRWVDGQLVYYRNYVIPSSTG